MGNQMNNLLPVFMKLEDNSCLVVGGGKIALQKIHQLLESKATVIVIAPEINESIKVLPVKLINRNYKTGDIDSASLVIAATNATVGATLNATGEMAICIFNGTEWVLGESLT